MKKILSAIFQEKVFLWLYRLAILAILVVTFFVMIEIKDDLSYVLSYTRSIDSNTNYIQSNTNDISSNTNYLDSKLNDIRSNTNDLDLIKLEVESISRTVRFLR